MKQPTTFEEQIKYIRKKGFLIEDKDVSACIDFLSKVNYYRLSAYFLPFKCKRNSFHVGINFNRVKDIYEFDSRLRTLIFGVIEDIEIHLRTQLSYHIAHKYGSLAYCQQLSNFVVFWRLNFVVLWQHKCRFKVRKLC